MKNCSSGTNECKVLLLQPLQLFILSSKNYHFMMHPLKNDPAHTVRRKLFVEIKFELTNHSKIYS